MKKKVCSECFEHYRKKAGEAWGKHCERTEEGQGCSKCQLRHLDEARNHIAKNVVLESKLSNNTELSELDAKQEKYDLKLPELEHLIALKKKKYQERISDLIADQKKYEDKLSELELDSIAQKKKGDQGVRLNPFKEMADKRVSDLESELTIQKETFDKRLSSLKRVLTRQVDTLKVANDRQRRQLEFLKLKRGVWTEDVLLETPDHQILANQNILAQKSPVFRQMLQIAKQPPAMVKVEGISSPILEAIVDFCYSGDILFSETVRPDEVLKIAHNFEIWLLKEACEAKLCQALTIDNTPEMFKLARLFSALELQKETAKLFKENYDLLFEKVFAIWDDLDSGTEVAEGTVESVG